MKGCFFNPIVIWESAKKNYKNMRTVLVALNLHKVIQEKDMEMH